METRRPAGPSRARPVFLEMRTEAATAEVATASLKESMAEAFTAADSIFFEVK